MPKSHLAPERPTAAERDASATRSVLTGTRPAGRWAVWGVCDASARVLARFPFARRQDADTYASKIGGFVQMLKEDRPADPSANPAPVVPRRRTAPACVRVWEDGVERVIPYTTRQEAINDAQRIVETLIDRRGGIVEHSHGVSFHRRRDGIRHVYTIVDVTER